MARKKRKPLSPSTAALTRSSGVPGWWTRKDVDLDEIEYHCVQWLDGRYPWIKDGRNLYRVLKGEGSVPDDVTIRQWDGWFMRWRAERRGERRG